MLSIHTWFLENLSLFGFIIAVINIAVTIFNWHISRPRVEFYKHNFKTIFKKSSPDEYGYLNSHCIVFSYAQIANLSSNPCTFSQFELQVPGYDSCFFRTGTHINEQYLITKDDKRSNTMLGEAVLKMPCTIPPYGYAEGVLLFPFAPEYSEDQLNGKIIARTSKRNFEFKVSLNRIS